MLLVSAQTPDFAQYGITRDRVANKYSRQHRAAQVLLLYMCILQGIYATEGLRPIPKPPLSVKTVAQRWLRSGA